MIGDALLDFQHAHLSKVWGKYAGTVVDNQDPNNMGRLKVSCLAVLGDGQVWAMPCVPYAGKNVGFYFIPPKGAGVWVEAELFTGADRLQATVTVTLFPDRFLPTVTAVRFLKVPPAETLAQRQRDRWARPRADRIRASACRPAPAQPDAHSAAARASALPVTAAQAASSRS